MLKGKKRKDILKRHQFADYLNVGTEDSPEYVLMGTGFSTLDESPGAQTSKKKYVNEASSSSSIKSYETSFPFESDLIKEEAAIIALYNVGRNHYTGSDAEFEYVRVELWDAVEGNHNEFAARKFIVSAEISNIKGEDEMQVSGNLNAVGDFVAGTYNTETRAFTEAEGVGGITSGTGNAGTGSPGGAPGSTGGEEGSDGTEDGPSE